MTLIVAGFETSANTLNWVWFLLADHPDVVDRLLDEIADTMPDRESVTADNAGNMKYTQQVLEETLRLYPPVWLFSRRAREDDELEDYDVRDGTDIYLAPYILHRTERYWADPERFDPDRFELTGGAKKDRPYFPFSLGPRRCLGEYFSFLEMKVHLALLLPRFVMSRVDDEDPGLELAINLRCKQDIRLQPSLRR
ncbi:MAG: cytochrome P450, partial [Pseudomonadota bacterium]